VNITVSGGPVSGVSRGRPNSSGAQLSRIKVKHSQHLPSKEKQKHCRVCSLNKKTKSTLLYCKKCDGLYVEDCFDQWRARVKVWALNGVIINCEVTQFIVACSLNKQLLSIVWLFFTKSTCLKFQEKTTGKSFGIS
jgi:hypothetical protein